MRPSDSNLTARERWDRKYRESPDSWLEPDPFLPLASSEYVRPAFPHGGSALDLAGGAGRHAIWLAKQKWQVTLIDVSETGVEQARQSAGPLSSHIHFVVDDLTAFTATQTPLNAAFDLVVVFFYLQRNIFPEILKALRPGGLLIYKTHTVAQTKLADGPKDAAHLLAEGELLRLAAGLHPLHYREVIAQKATAELVATKEP